MAVNEILDEIENLVVDAKHLLFTNKSLVEENDLVRLVEDLRNELPLELQKAEQIMQDRQKMQSSILMSSRPRKPSKCPRTANG